MKRLNSDGLPVDAREWTAADWQDLHEAIEGVKRKVKARHERIAVSTGGTGCGRVDIGLGALSPSARNS